MFARLAALDELGSGDQSVAKRHLLDDIGVVACPTKPLVDDIDEPDVIGTVKACVHQVGPVDIEDHEMSRAAGSSALCHGWHHGRGVLRGFLTRCG